ncbi:Protein of unknown function [Gryllus bimaculatus]|nr:Protein of unknown function [Gryllus bimaculatus]
MYLRSIFGKPCSEDAMWPPELSSLEETPRGFSAVWRGVTRFAHAIYGSARGECFREESCARVSGPQNEC